jgi:hypothetical protein
MNLVATLNLGNLWYAGYTLPFMRRYAEAVGADFREYREFDGSRLEVRWPGWYRLEVLREFAERERYEALLLLDADVLVMPGCPDLFELGEGRIAAVRDMGLPEVTSRHVDWCVRHFGERPGYSAYFNSGVMVFPRVEVRRLMPLLGGPYPDDGYPEQDYLNLRVQNRVPVTFLPEEFNWLAPQFTEGALTKQAVHFVGGHKGLLPEFVGRLG